MNTASTLENVYHEIMLRNCINEESAEWENRRHEIMSESIKDSCNYYATRNVNHEDENERERE